jgi:hypothetical protein
MESEHAPWLLATLILSLLALAGSVTACWIAVSRASRHSKLLRELAQMPPSDANLAKALADQAELFSTLGKLTTTVKRLSSRAGMEDIRSRRQGDDAPPPGASKAEVRRHYGFTRDGPAFAAHQLTLVPKE